MKAPTPRTDKVAEYIANGGAFSALDAHARELERENDQLRALLGASLRDTERLDWIGAEEAMVDRFDRVETYWFEGVALRDAIDQAMTE